MPLISLTTDFGHKGPFVAVMKAVILGRCPQATVVDFTHEIPVHWPPEAGFWLARAWQYFPAGSVHVAVVDPGVGTERDILLASVAGHRFLAPDNGLLAPVLDAAGQPQVYRLDHARLRGAIGLASPSATFHGRDIFAPVAAELAAGRLAESDAGEPAQDWTPSQIDPAEAGDGRVAGTVVTIDNFGNLITNIDAAMIAGIEAPCVNVGGHRYPMAETYGRVRPGDYVGLVNSFDVVEIARAEGNASEGLGLERGAPVTVEPTPDAV
ncbi:MAG: SAM-dependent chlorinase/fluorinase [Pseudomonadota bacterium]